MKDIPIVDKIPELDIAIKAAREAGNAILEIYQGDFKVSKKMMILQLQKQILRVMKSLKKFSHKRNTQYYLKKMRMIKVDYQRIQFGL